VWAWGGEKCGEKIDLYMRDAGDLYEAGGIGVFGMRVSRQERERRALVSRKKGNE
jgi:hypothetical protein